MALKDPSGIPPLFVNVPTNDVDTSAVSTPFGSTTGSWTVSAGDIFKYDWYVIGNFVVIIYDLRNTTISGSPSELRLNLPVELHLAREGYCGAGHFDSPLPDAASTNQVAVTVSGAISRIIIERAGLGAFPSSGSNNVNVHGIVMGPLAVVP